MAHRKAGGSTRLGRDSISKRLGVKIFGDQKVEVGNVIIKQRGLKYQPGKNVALGGDDTIYAMKTGLVKFSRRMKKCFDGRLKKISVVSVEEK